jgi:hypothetical protein
MITAILAFLQVIPALMGGVNNFVSKYYDAKVQLTAARIGGDVTVATAMVNASVAAGHERVEGLKAIAGSRVLLFLVVGFAGPWIIYEWKVVVWDNVFAYFTNGSTPPIKGLVADWGGIIIASLFGSSTAVTVGSMYFNRSKAGE